MKLNRRRNKNIITEFVRATNQNEWDKLDSLVASKIIRHSSAAGQPEIRMRDQLKQFHQQELKTFPDIREEILFMISEGEMVAARINFQGTQ